MKIGDKFRFNIEKMKENQINLPDEKDQNKIHTIMDIQEEKDLGFIITYNLNPYAEVNSCWIMILIN